MRTVRILDLFCGAGGSAVGYHRAFTAAGYAVEITGVDTVPQPRYPYHFCQADAMTFPLDGYAFIHASPPCQDHSIASNGHESHGTGWILPATYKRLTTQQTPWVIENVGTAKMRHPLMLCGSMFGLNIVRHRLFDSSHLLYPAGTCKHTGLEVTVCGHGTPSWTKKRLGRNPSIIEKRKAMGIDWMNRNELSQAIPPIYTEWLGMQIVNVIAQEAVA